MSDDEPHTTNLHAAAATLRDAIVQALNAGMTVRQISDETGLPPHEIERIVDGEVRST